MIPLKVAYNDYLMQHTHIYTSLYLFTIKAVHTKNDNYKDNNKDIVLKIVLNLKE